MFIPNKLLKVMSIIVIVLSVLGIISLLAGYYVVNSLEVPGVDMSMLKEAYTPLSMGMSLISSVSMIVAGVLGFSGKSFKGCAAAIGIYTVMIAISCVQSTMLTGFNPLLAIDFIIPALFIWGLYQSK
ncbi:hypothetical protein ABXS75_00170 [Roseburia hominis]